jgi:F-type H+-transporting ATPase subunit delta
MLNPRLAQRYAKSLLGLALEKGLLEPVYADMQWLQSVCKSNRDFVNVLKSPVIKADIKLRIVSAVTNGRVSELTHAFNSLLIRKSRESVLPEIITAFVAAYKEHMGIQPVHLATPSPLSEEIKQLFAEQVKKQGGFQKVELHEQVKPDLIGGFVLQVGDKLVDASVAYDLRTIARQFERNDFIYKIR